MASQTSDLFQKFDIYFRDCVKAAYQEWSYPMPSDDYYDSVNHRLPEGLRTSLGLGLIQGIIIPIGKAFKLKGLSSIKGPYNWLSRSVAREPNPNYEYFVQVAEFVRLHNIATNLGLSVAFEDHTMDIALYQNSKLIVYYEVKEKISQIQELIEGIKDYGYTIIDPATPDRGNDPLRKAKCIAKRKPEYFVGVAIGARFEYKVIYPDDRSFHLVRDIVPLV